MWQVEGIYGYMVLEGTMLIIQMPDHKEFDHSTWNLLMSVRKSFIHLLSRTNQQVVAVRNKQLKTNKHREFFLFFFFFGGGEELGPLKADLCMKYVCSSMR